MAKSLRASVKKANKSKLRSNVFARVEDARNERLSAKLLELASKPKEVDMKEDTTTETPCMMLRLRLLAPADPGPAADVLPEGDAVPEDETTMDCEWLCSRQASTCHLSH